MSIVPLTHPDSAAHRKLLAKAEGGRPTNTYQLNILNDGTDQTTELVAFFDGLSETEKGVYEISFGTSFDRKTVIASIPKSVTVIDNSGYDYN